VGGRNDNDDQERAVLCFKPGEQGVGKERIHHPVHHRYLVRFSQFGRQLEILELLDTCLYAGGTCHQLVIGAKNIDDAVVDCTIRKREASHVGNMDTDYREPDQQRSSWCKMECIWRKDVTTSAARGRQPGVRRTPTRPGTTSMGFRESRTGVGGTDTASTATRRPPTSLRVNGKASDDSDKANR
jgi:hypothetical protein